MFHGKGSAASGSPARLQPAGSCPDTSPARQRLKTPAPRFLAQSHERPISIYISRLPPPSRLPLRRHVLPRHPPLRSPLLLFVPFSSSFATPPSISFSSPHPPTTRIHVPAPIDLIPFRTSLVSRISIPRDGELDSPYSLSPSPETSLITFSPLRRLSPATMGNKRPASEAIRPSTPKSAAKRQRALSGLPRLVTPPRPATPARPPRIPRFSPDPITTTADRRLVQEFHMLSTPQLVALVKDVEARFRKLAQFEANEIRRAQALGFAEKNSPLVVRRQHVAW
ncbi:unnamed protein product [Chondrus crispus]|uniref:Uncharacterized protein n=1 Tax=Chondrus crispus TaxID=2769 RepID=R7QN27_CHOCR|nr:unnamed protein product [Chondrus crispus]CDF39183.1 unnamed protein product [Chondrus crispus]|eukprot:XP_005719094.1 unnamed protein product [Chondrus crispus]